MISDGTRDTEDYIKTVQSLNKVKQRVLTLHYLTFMFASG